MAKEELIKKLKSLNNEGLRRYYQASMDDACALKNALKRYETLSDDSLNAREMAEKEEVGLGTIYFWKKILIKYNLLNNGEVKKEPTNNNS